MYDKPMVELADRDFDILAGDGADDVDGAAVAAELAGRQQAHASEGLAERASSQECRWSCEARTQRWDQWSPDTREYWD